MLFLVKMLYGYLRIYCEPLGVPGHAISPCNIHQKLKNIHCLGHIFSIASNLILICAYISTYFRPKMKSSLFGNLMTWQIVNFHWSQETRLIFVWSKWEIKLKTLPTKKWPKQYINLPLYSFCWILQEEIVCPGALKWFPVIFLEYSPYTTSKEAKVLLYRPVAL